MGGDTVAPVSTCSCCYGNSWSSGQNSKGWYIKRVNAHGGLFSLAPFSSCIMQTLFVQTFLFCPKELRGVSDPQAGQVLPAEASCAARGHKQLAKSSQPAAGKWYFWRKSLIGPARGCKLQPGLTRAIAQCLSCSSPLHQAAGRELQDGHSQHPGWPEGTAGIPHRCVLSFSEKGWETLGWKKHKLESRLPGKISITSDMQMTLPLWQKAKN